MYSFVQDLLGSCRALSPLCKTVNGEGLVPLAMTALIELYFHLCSWHCAAASAFRGRGSGCSWHCCSD